MLDMKKEITFFGVESPFKYVIYITVWRAGGGRGGGNEKMIPEAAFGFFGWRVGGFCAKKQEKSKNQKIQEQVMILNY
jgi:hypothetical protein